MKTINLSALAGEDGDLVQAFREALAASAPGDALRLTLETGIYPLRQSRCRRFFAAISNHDSAERAIAFMLSGHDAIEFDGRGSLLLCEGRFDSILGRELQACSAQQFSHRLETPIHKQGGNRGHCRCRHSSPPPRQGALEAAR